MFGGDAILETFPEKLKHIVLRNAIRKLSQQSEQRYVIIAFNLKLRFCHLGTPFLMETYVGFRLGSGSADCYHSSCAIKLPGINLVQMDVLPKRCRFSIQFQGIA